MQAADLLFFNISVGELYGNLTPDFFIRYHMIMCCDSYAELDMCVFFVFF